MINTYLYNQFLVHFPFEPSSQQEDCMQQLSSFFVDRTAESVFLLKGFAGTGKSSLIGAVVQALQQLKQKCILLAPTGRAAKVMGTYAKHPAFTIHKKIYRQKSFSHDLSNFSIADNLHQDTFFFVDEASMISNEGIDSHSFGSGRLLDDLIHYIYSGRNCRLILLGDTAQLPPIGQQESPALRASVLQSYGLTVTEITLTQVLRQDAMSGILSNATALRQALEQSLVHSFPKLQPGGNVYSITGADLLDSLEQAYARDGVEETLVITRSNKRANLYNQGIRNRILYREEEVSSGDLLLVAKNNYFWSEHYEGLDFIANGDIVELKRTRNWQELYGFRFCDASVYFPDYDREVELKMLLDTLQSEAASLAKTDADRFYQGVMDDYADISSQAEKLKRIKIDPFYNALQVKFAYALTCHKAQGGQWKNVFLDIGYISEEHLGVDFYRWLYTAFTRASERLFLVNLPKEFWLKSSLQAEKK